MISSHLETLKNNLFISLSGLVRREKVPLKIQTLQLDQSHSVCTESNNNQHSRTRKTKQNYKRYHSPPADMSSSSSETSLVMSSEVNQIYPKDFLTFDMFDPRRLSLGEIKQKYKINKSKPRPETDIFKLIPPQYYDEVDQQYEAVVQRKHSRPPRPRKPAKPAPAKTILSTPKNNPDVEKKNLRNVRFQQSSTESGNESGSEGSIKIIMPKCKKI